MGKKTRTTGQSGRTGRRPAKRRRTPGILYAILSTAVVVAVIVASVTVFFEIKSVEVAGDTRYGAEDIKATSGITVGDNMFMINKFAAIRQMEEAYPYLDTVTIRRRLPDTIVISVEETEPVAAVAQADKLWLINDEGKLLEEVPAGSESARGLLVVKGLALVEPMAGNTMETDEKDQLKPLFDILHMAGNGDILNQMGELDLSKLYDIRFTYGDRFSVILGTVDGMEKKFKFFDLVLDELTKDDRGVIDLSNAEKEVRFIPESQ